MHKRCKFVLQIMHVLLLEYGKRVAIFNQNKKEDKKMGEMLAAMSGGGAGAYTWSMVHGVRNHGIHGPRPLAQQVGETCSVLVSYSLSFLCYMQQKHMKRERSITVGVGERERERVVFPCNATHNI